MFSQPVKRICLYGTVVTLTQFWEVGEEKSGNCYEERVSQQNHHLVYIEVLR